MRILPSVLKMKPACRHGLSGLYHGGARCASRLDAAVCTPCANRLTNQNAALYARIRGPILCKPVNQSECRSLCTHMRRCRVQSRRHITYGYYMSPHFLAVCIRELCLSLFASCLLAQAIETWLTMTSKISSH